LLAVLVVSPWPVRGQVPGAPTNKFNEKTIKQWTLKGGEPTAEEKALLDGELEEFRRNPQAGSPWQWLCEPPAKRLRP